MNDNYLVFLKILKDSLNNKKTHLDINLSRDEWRFLFKLASVHDILPLFVNSVFEDSSLNQYPQFKSQIISRAKKITLSQAKKTFYFISLYQEMIEANLKPIIMKGIICRSLYPDPELRPSCDEDIYISSSEIFNYHKFLLDHGFLLVDPNIIDLLSQDEISYYNKKTHLYLEIHQRLFPTSFPLFNRLNMFFPIPNKQVFESIYDSYFYTLDYTEHLLYMLFHAYKHFLYSGIGIRQIADIYLFSKKFDSLIDWNYIIQSCISINIQYFVSAIFSICFNYFGLDCNHHILLLLDDYEIDEESLLFDILSGGSYGTSSRDRLHSSNMVLETASAYNDKRNSHGFTKTIFPNYIYMKQKYSFLNNRKYLLPYAWLLRLFDYFFSSHKRRTNFLHTIKIGTDRIAVLRKYHLID